MERGPPWKGWDGVGDGGGEEGRRIEVLSSIHPLSTLHYPFIHPQFHSPFVLSIHPSPRFTSRVSATTLFPHMYTPLNPLRPFAEHAHDATNATHSLLTLLDTSVQGRRLAHS